MKILHDHKEHPQTARLKKCFDDTCSSSAVLCGEGLPKLFDTHVVIKRANLVTWNNISLKTCKKVTFITYDEGTPPFTNSEDGLSLVLKKYTD